MKTYTYYLMILGAVFPMIALSADNQKLIGAVAEETGIEQQKVERIVESFWKNVQQRLSNGEEVSLSELGVLSVKKKLVRVGRNPDTGTEDLDQNGSRNVLHFKPSKALKEAVNAGPVQD